MILKPAEFTSLTALLFAEIVEKAGLPKGVVNIVTGEGDTGAAIVNHPDIDKIAFTGSTEVGKIIRAATAGTGKGLSLELGGKSPYIVFEDADIDSAIEGLVDAIWFNQGQVCCAGSRLLVQEIDRGALHQEAQEAHVDAPRRRSARQGRRHRRAGRAGAGRAHPRSDEARRRRRRGASTSPTCDLPAKGCFLQPALITNVSPANTLVTEEIFGPVLVAMSFRTPEEAVALANNTKYGLAATIWSENINLALDIAPKIKAGVVWINGTNNFDAAVGFGGYKESGFGREGGREGMARLPEAGLGEGAEAGSASAKAAASARPDEPARLLDGGIDRTAKMYIGGKQARPDSRLFAPGPRPERQARRRSRRRQPQGHPQRRRSRPRRARLGAPPPPTPARRSSTSSPRTSTTAATNSPPASGADRREHGAARRKSPPPSSGSSPSPAGPTSTMAPCTIRRSAPSPSPWSKPIGVIGIVAPPSRPLLGSVALLAPALAMGNPVVLVPSEQSPLSVTDLYQVHRNLRRARPASSTSSPATASSLAKTLAEHDGVDALWFAGDAEASTMVEKASIGNLKQTWTTPRPLLRPRRQREVRRRLLPPRATQVKNVWVPYGA